MSNINIDKLIHSVESALDHHLTWTAQARYIGRADITPPVGVSAIAEVIRTLHSYVEQGEQRPLQQRGEIMEGIQHLCETLFSCAWLNGYEIPAHFWDSELGSIMQQAQNIALGDELITLSEAGNILRPVGKLTARLNRVSEQIKKGKLTEYIDPNEPNPMRNRRVKKSEVLKLKAELKEKA